MVDEARPCVLVPLSTSGMSSFLVFLEKSPMVWCDAVDFKGECTGCHWRLKVMRGGGKREKEGEGEGERDPPPPTASLARTRGHGNSRTRRNDRIAI